MEKKGKKEIINWIIIIAVVSMTTAILTTLALTM